MAAAQWPCPIAVTRVSLFGQCVSSVDTGTQVCETAIGAVMSAPGGRYEGLGGMSKPCPPIIRVTALSQSFLELIFA